MGAPALAKGLKPGIFFFFFHFKRDGVFVRAGLSNANLIESPLLLLRPQVFLVGGISLQMRIPHPYLYRYCDTFQ